MSSLQPELWELLFCLQILLCIFFLTFMIVKNEGTTAYVSVGLRGVRRSGAHGAVFCGGHFPEAVSQWNTPIKNQILLRANNTVIWHYPWSVLQTRHAGFCDVTGHTAGLFQPAYRRRVGHGSYSSLTVAVMSPGDRNFSSPL